MIRLLFFLLCNSFVFVVYCQQANNLINEQEVTRIESALSADSMQGRKAGTPGIEKAAGFIASEFKKAGLQTMQGLNDYRQTFTMVRPAGGTIKAIVNGEQKTEKEVVVISPQQTLTVNDKTGYRVIRIKAGENLLREAYRIIGENIPTLVLADTSFTMAFARLPRLKGLTFSTASNTVFILSNTEVVTFNIEMNQQVDLVPMSNVVAVLPGKSKPSEMVIFSGHYDHLGVMKPVNGDSIYNGANDDASGTTAVIALAKYYKALDSNERTLVFVAFTAEEIGGFGSTYFSKQVKPDDVVAMFNIEMIGTESKWNKSSAYITGYEKTNMGEILQANLQGSQFTFHPDPYPTEQLFYRSDNATLARLGVPAHTISTSKMDSEANYHKASDEIGTLDMKNMTEIIKAIAQSASSIVSGKDAPSRVKSEDLRR